MARRQRGEGSVYQRHDHPTCPPLEEIATSAGTQRIRPKHKCRGRWTGKVDLGWVMDGDKPKRKTKVIYAQTQAAAVVEVRKLRAKIEANQFTLTDPTVEEWLTYWIEQVAKPRLKPRVVATHRSAIRQHIVPAIGRLRLSKLTLHSVRAMHSQILDGGRSTGTALNAHRTLTNALNDAVREGVATRNVAALVKAPPRGQTRGALTFDEAQRLLTAVAGDRLESRWMFALFTGARQGECLGLTWAHLDLDAGVVDLAWQLQRIPYRHGCPEPCERRADRCPDRELDFPPGFQHRQLVGNLCLVQPKTTGSTRVVPLVPALLDSLRRRHAAYLGERTVYRADHQLVWCRPDGRPIEAVTDLTEWHRHLDKARVNRQTLHAARHTTATLLLALGVSERVIMAILGHSEAATTRGYQHVDTSMQRQALESLSTAVGVVAG